VKRLALTVVALLVTFGAAYLVRLYFVLKNLR
jgi:hypothetical protein